MKVQSYVTGGARRLRDDTPKMPLTGTGHSIRYNDERVSEYKKWHHGADGRTYEVFLDHADIEAILLDVSRHAGGLKMIREVVRLREAEATP